MQLRSIFLWVLSVLSIVFACSGYALTDAQSAEDIWQRVENKGILVVGTEGTYPPFTYHDATGKLTGYDIEVLYAVANKLGIKLEFRETQWDAMLAGLNSHRFDLVANQVALTTPERREKYEGTTPYGPFGFGAVVIARKGDTRIKSWSDVKGLKSAQSLISNYGEKAQQYGAEIVPVDGLAQAIQLVIQKRADISINDYLAVLDYKKQHPNAPIEIVAREEKPEALGARFVFNKGNDKVIKKFNEALETLRADGTLKRLSEEFFGEDVSEKVNTQ